MPQNSSCHMSSSLPLYWELHPAIILQYILTNLSIKLSSRPTGQVIISFYLANHPFISWYSDDITLLGSVFIFDPNNSKSHTHGVFETNNPIMTFHCTSVYLKVLSYYTAIALWYQYINYISATSYCSITAFQVKMNLTSMRHWNSVTSHKCAMQQRNAIAV